MKSNTKKSKVIKASNAHFIPLSLSFHLRYCRMHTTKDGMELIMPKITTYKRRYYICFKYPLSIYCI